MGVRSNKPDNMLSEREDTLHLPEKYRAVADEFAQPIPGWWANFEPTEERLVAWTKRRVAVEIATIRYERDRKTKIWLMLWSKLFSGERRYIPAPGFSTFVRQRLAERTVHISRVRI